MSQKERGASLTDDIVSKLVLGNVVEKGCEDREQGDGGVVDVLGDAFNLQESADTEGKDTGLQGQRAGKQVEAPDADLIPTRHFAQL